jgi:anaerobic magnesium-protoporphyrin IX monomethyl ester cyclase
MIKSPFTPRKPKDFRILLFYPNLHMSALMPQSIGIFTSLFKREGYTLDLFDCTHYQDIDEINLGRNTNDESKKNKRVHAYDNEEWFKKTGKPKTGIKEDFVKKVQEFRPDLILVSVLESTYNLSIELLNAVPLRDKKYKTLFGGVFATYAAEKVIKDNNVDYICRGEGEGAIIEMCNQLISGGRIDNILNFTIKGNGQIYRNRLRAAIDINNMPIPNWDLFDPGSIYRPMQGKIYRAVGVETQRGCPYTCTFCNSPSNNVIYKEEANKIFHRKKSIKKIKEELDFLVKKYDPQLIYFVVDTFLAMSNREFDEFKEMYMDYKIPFWMNTRAETITEHRAAGLEDMNMLRMNIGIEHGNYEYRKNYLKRNVSDEIQIKAFEMVADKKYTSCANSIIGMPDENRDLIFDTIKFVRKLPKNIDATGAFIFVPFHGTPLRELAIKKGYLNDNEVASIANTSRSMLRMPSISQSEISEIAKVFSFYVKFPESRWNDIKIAEKSTPEGEKMFKSLGQEFDQKYRMSKPSMMDLHD